MQLQKEIKQLGVDVSPYLLRRLHDRLVRRHLRRRLDGAGGHRHGRRRRLRGDLQRRQSPLRLQPRRRLRGRRLVHDDHLLHRLRCRSRCRCRSSAWRSLLPRRRLHASHSEDKKPMSKRRRRQEQDRKKQRAEQPARYSRKEQSIFRGAAKGRKKPYGILGGAHDARSVESSRAPDAWLLLAEWRRSRAGGGRRNGAVDSTGGVDRGGKGRDGKARRASERGGGFGWGNLGTACVSALARGGRENERLREPNL